ncbi:hypothetical protein [Pedobacter nototheniae]|uniref:hypothetical protein n=1 Tax=Pedobacter nototheniae TaxID=2488994 RepID=UPI00292F13AB|nr:hypothetical protein [Pedobacter nototheniae]
MENEKKTTEETPKNPAHPKPSDEVQLDIETVTPQTEKNAGQANPKADQVKPDKPKEESAAKNPEKDEDKGEDIETVTP